MLLYDAILQNGETEQDAIEYANGMVWCEIESVEQERPFHSRHVQDVNGIGIHYDFGADYYFFEDLTY